METTGKKPQLYSIVFDDRKKNRRDDVIGWVPTMSEHGKCVKDRINDLLDECPECANLIFALLTYSTQKWASEQRKLLGIDRKVSIELRHEADSAAELMAQIYRRTGIVPQTSGKALEVIEDSDRILGCLEDALGWIGNTPGKGENFGDVLRAVHFSTPGHRYPDVSNFLINKYYRDAVLCMYDAYGKRIDALVNVVMSPAFMCDGGITSDAYHDTALCLKLYPEMMNRFAVRGEMDGLSDISAQRDSDGLSLLRTLEKAVKGVAGFPGDGETMYWILLLMMEGKNQEEMLSVMDLGRQALARHTARAVNLLSFVLWGYSTVQILNGIVLTPFARGNSRY